jgi:hypothetical protein
VTLAVWAVLDLDFPPRDTQLLSTCGEIAGGSARTDKVVPAVLAWENGSAKFGDAHGGDVFR